jgi:hypothetical protein
MRSTFKVRDREYQVVLEKGERGEGDKFNPFEATVSGQASGPVIGTLQLTDSALEAAEKQASSEGGSADDLLAKACGRSLASEILIRRLEPDFSVVVDHRWLAP